MSRVQRTRIWAPTSYPSALPVTRSGRRSAVPKRRGMLALHRDARRERREP